MKGISSFDVGDRGSDGGLTFSNMIIIIADSGLSNYRQERASWQTLQRCNVGISQYWNIIIDMGILERVITSLIFLLFLF